MRMKIEENQDFGRGNDCSECSIEICVHCKPDCLGDLHHDENADISRMVTGDYDHDDAGNDHDHDNHNHYYIERGIVTPPFSSHA